MVTIDVSLPDRLKDFVDARVDGRTIKTTGDYLVGLVERDQAQRLEALRRHVEEARASGVSTRTMAEIFQDAVEVTKARGTYRD